MGVLERREREKAALRKRILDAGREILVEEGYQALTMRKLAEKIEYTPGALYVHFPDKDALVRAICQLDMQEFAKKCRAALAVSDAMEKLRALARLYASFALEHPQQYKVLFVLDPVPALDHDAIVERGNPESDAYAILELAVESALAAGHFPAFESRPQLVAQLLWAGMHGVVSIENRRHEGMKIPFEPIEDRVATMCDAMLAGLARVDVRGAAPRDDVARSSVESGGARSRRKLSS
jgi:AcrR family transcriptional regulator